MMQRILAVAAVWMLATAAHAQAPDGSSAHADLTAQDLNAWLDGYLPYALHSGDLAGAVVVVVKDGQILTERGYGYADVAARKPVDPKLTLFRPGSVSKLFTWTAVMQLVEQGRIDLDGDVNQYLDFKIPPREGKPVTMRELMQHVAGFEEQAKGIITDDAHGPSYESLLKQWVPGRIFAPGTTPAYSNSGASLAGYIVQRVSGEPFDAYIEKHLFEPLEMAHSTFQQPLPADLVPLMSKGYVLASDPPRPFEIIGPAPAGGLSSPGEDMAHFMIAHLQDGEYNGKRILQAATAQMMHDSPLTIIPHLDRMELGFFETNINGHEVIGHLGDTDCFHTSLHLFLKEQVGFYVSFNSAGRNGAAGPLRMALFEDFADRYFPAAQTPKPLDAKTAARDAALLAGTWVNSRRSQSNFLAAVSLLSQIKVGVDHQGNLVAPFPALNGKPRHWVEIAPFLWRDPDSHQRLAAQIVNGKAVRFSFDELSPFMVFDRAPWYCDSAWLVPLVGTSIAALLLTVVLWPVAALVRRHYGRQLALDPRARRAYRDSRIASLAILVALGLWTITLWLMITRLDFLGTKSDWLVILDQIVSLVAIVGGSWLLLRHLAIVWSGRRRWPSKLWSVVLAISGAAVLWLALVVHLIGFGVHY